MKKKTYTITLEKDKNGKSRMHRTNDGFSPIELLGICELIQLEILQQMNKAIEPDIIKREVVDEREGKE